MSGVRRLSDTALSGAASGATAGQSIILNSATGHYAPGTAKYQRGLQLYNLTDTSFSKWNLAYAIQRAGTTQAKLLMLGDSITGGSSGVSGDRWTTSVPGRLRALLDAKTGTASGTGIVGPTTYAQNANAGFVPTGSFSWSASTNFTQIGPYGTFGQMFYSTTAGNTYTLNWTGAGTMRVWYGKGLGSGTNTVTLDSSASTSITTNGSPAAAPQDYTPAGSGAHSLVFTVGSGAQLNLIGFEYLPTLTAGVRVSNLGVGGATAAQATGTANLGTGLTASAYAADLTVIWYGTNEANTSVAVSTYTTNIQAAITQAQQSGDALLVTPPRSPTGGSITPYCDALYAISDSTGVPVLDLRNRYAANPNSYMDNVGHPTNTTASDMAAALYVAVTAQVPV